MNTTRRRFIQVGVGGIAASVLGFNLEQAYAQLFSAGDDHAIRLYQ